MKKALSMVVLASMVVMFLWACGSGDDPNVIKIHMLTEEGTGENIGTVRTTESEYGILFTPDLKGLPPGLHGFHLHTEGTCGSLEKDGVMVPGLASGGHYDPAGTGAHKGPYGNGHLGDLPALYVDDQGHATLPVLAPRLKAADLKGRALMIHSGGDNYSDTPEMGGGGGRIACGVIVE